MKQGCVDCSTNGVDLVAIREVVEAIGGLLYDLHCMGVNVRLPIVVYCDNQSVIASGATPGSPLKKKHLGLAYHLVREAVAAGIICLCFIKSQDNLADLLTKALGSMIFRTLTERTQWCGGENRSG